MSTLAHDASYARAEPVAVSATDVGLLCTRLALAAIFIAHGGMLVFGWFGGPGLAGTAASFAHMGIPPWPSYIAALSQFLGGLGMLVGLLARLSALGIIVNMLVAIFLVHLPNGFFMNWYGKQKGEGFEFHILAIAAALMVLLAGPGRIAIADLEAAWLRRTPAVKP